MFKPMKILVCVKQVPESESPIAIDESTGWIESDAISEYRMNRLDEYAVEEALLIKETFADSHVDVITVGPDRSEAIIRRAVGMGADSGIHLKVLSEGYLSAFEVAGRLADFATGRNYALILTGAMSEDSMQGQVGPMLAAHLDYVWATSVIAEKISPDRKTIYVEREIEGGHRHSLALDLPAVITIQSGINTPRWPTLSNLLRANSQGLETVSADASAKFEPMEYLTRVTYPQKSRTGLVLSGTMQEKAVRLMTILAKKSILSPR